MVRAVPGGRVTRRLVNPTALGVPLTFLVKGEVHGWVDVYLPVRPDGSRGWVRRRDVRISGVPYRIDVHRGAHRLDLYKYGERIRRFPIGVGTSDTPTPGGVYYLKELLRPPDPHGLYGPYAFGLSGFSNVLHTFDGGNGVIGIHGTSDPASIGRSVSHGCVRMRNADITYLAKRLPLGTPVRIRR
jgi:lipoprotein-anchoring transpeptidase ErfK/SrfK